MSLRLAGNPQKTEENRASHRGNPQKTWGGQGGQRADNSAGATADKGGQPETRRGHGRTTGGQRGLSGSGQADSAPIGARCPPCLSACPSATASGPVRPALEENRRGDPSAALADPLARAARLVAALRPDWQRPERFHETKAEALAAIRAAASDRCAGCPAAALRERLRRAHALLQASAAETDRYRRLLATAVRPKRRRAVPDARQTRLPLEYRLPMS